MSDIRRFITGSSSSSSSPASASSAKKTVVPVLEPPRDLDAYKLPPALQKLVDEQSGHEARALWLVPGVLSWGESPMERLDPQQWTNEQGIRLVVDVSAMLRDDDRYRSNMARAGAVLVHLPLTSRVKVPPGTINDMVVLLRVLHAIVSDGKAVPDGQRPLAVHLCDSYGGDPAATLAAPLLTLAMGCSLLDASVAINRMWRDNTARGSAATGGSRMFPGGEPLKRAIMTVFNRLRERSMAASGSAALVPVIFVDATTLDVAETAVTALRVLDIDPRLVLQPPPFTRRDPTRAITWTMHSTKWSEERAYEQFDRLIAQAHARAEENDAPPKRSKQADGDDDGGSDDDDDGENAHELIM